MPSQSGFRVRGKDRLIFVVAIVVLVLLALLSGTSIDFEVKPATATASAKQLHPGTELPPADVDLAKTREEQRRENLMKKMTPRPRVIMRDLPEVEETEAPPADSAEMHKKGKGGDADQEADPWDASAWDPDYGTTTSSATSVGKVFPKCAVLGPRFVKYVDSHFQKLGRTYDEQKQAKKSATHKIGRLIYNCESNKQKRFCGGTGDRFRGMITTFFLALVTKRQFYLHQPAPAPLQKLLRPNWFNWVPHDVKSGGVESIPLDDQLMRLKNHRKFVASLAKTPNTADLRLQSNSFGIDPYLYGNPLFNRILTEEMGLGLQCNMTGYFGCLWDVLFTPSPKFKDAIEKVFVKATAIANGQDGLEDDAAAAGGGGQFNLDEIRVKPFLAVQIRVGGDWAPGLRIKEPFRTPPSTLPHFYKVIEELRTGAVHPGQLVATGATWSGVSGGGGGGGGGGYPKRKLAAYAADDPSNINNLDALQGCMIFVSSDAPRLITEMQSHFGKKNIFFVPDAYNHTDTLNLGDVKPGKYAKVSEAAAEKLNMQTLVSHYLLGEGAHLVMAQSGFGDTAYWRGRRSASSIFVDMNKPKIAWQHHSGYKRRSAGTGGGGAGGGGNGNADSTHTSAEKEKWGTDCGSRAVLNRIIDTRNKPKPYYID